MIEGSYSRRYVQFSFSNNRVKKQLKIVTVVSIWGINQGFDHHRDNNWSESVTVLWFDPNGSCRVFMDGNGTKQVLRLFRLLSRYKANNLFFRFMELSLLEIYCINP